jgi:cytochrome c biogenesis protein CcdA
VLWLCAGWPSSPSCCRRSTTVYAIGYTLVLFLASLFAGLATASRRVLAHTELISRTAAGTLIIIGVVTFAYGVEQL